MKSMKIIQYIIFIFICQALVSCTNPVQIPEAEPKQALVLSEPAPKQAPILSEPAPELEELVLMAEIPDTEPEYVYTIIGTWEREFDGHIEEYVFTESELITYCDDNWNGTYDIEYLEDWTFLIGDTVFDYELLHTDGVQDALVLCGYVYRREE